MNKDLLNLIPKHIIDIIEPAKIDVTIVLACHAFNSHWPMIKLTINDQIAYDGETQGLFQFDYSFHINPDQDTFSIVLTYHDKLDTYTKVDDQGNIIENQGVDIKKLVINGVDIVESNIIHQVGQFTPIFSPAKLCFFKDNNIDTGPSTTLGVYENGVWDMTFKLPVLSYFSEIQHHIEFNSNDSWQPLVAEIFARVLNCEKLEQQRKTRF
jgi:hypothetical protein